MTVTNVEKHDSEKRDISEPSTPNSISRASNHDEIIQDQEKNVPPNTHSPETQTWTPPDGGYGWICVATVFLINAHTWGMNSSYGVFLAHYLTTESFPGATRIQYAFIGGLSISTALLISPLATTTTRILGTRTTLLIGVILEAISLISASFASKIWHLFLSQGLCFGVGMGFLFVGSVGVVPQWFIRRRSLANGISAAGGGFGGLVYSLATGSMIRNLGVPWTFRILGILAFVVNFLCAILLKDRNKQLGSSQMAFDVRLLKRVEFCVLLGFGVFSMLGYVVLLFSIPAYATHVGISSGRAAVVGAILNLGQGLGRPFMGYFSDSFGRLNMAGTMTFLSGLFVLVIWINAKSFGVLIFYGLIGGAVAGTFWAVVGPVTAEVVGVKELPAALSITWVTLFIPTLFSEPIGLAIVANSQGSYLGAQLFCGIMYLAAAACVVWLKAWKIGQMERQANQERRQEGTSSPHQKSSFIVRLFMWKKV